MERRRLGDVFTAGGQPTVTYVERQEKQAATKIDKYLLTGKTILSVTGPSKSGKTVLCQRKIPDGTRIDVAGGQTNDMNSFWAQIAHALEVPIQTTVASSSSTNTHLHGKAGGSASLGFADVSLGGKVDRTTNDASSSSVTRDMDPATAVLQALEKSRKTLVIDDFHFIPIDVQRQITRSLKQPIFRGLNVVILSVPHRGFDVANAEQDMSQRLQQAEIPQWTVAELEKIAIDGFSALNMDVDKKISNQLAHEAYGSPNLMQRFCQELCFENNVTETLPAKTRVGTKKIETFLTAIAKDQPPEVHEKLARGQRSDRKMRLLVDGTSADIYEIVLRAIADCLPGTPIPFDDVRTATRDMVQEAPQNHEITRVLQKISEIAAEDSPRDPVIVWDGDNRKLHIADPGFAFYLKWGYFQGARKKRNK
jgi:hypothetical protein